MSTEASTILLWLFVINLGIAFGAGLYEHRVVMPNWITHEATGPHKRPPDLMGAYADADGRYAGSRTRTHPAGTVFPLRKHFRARPSQRGVWPKSMKLGCQRKPSPDWCSSTQL